VTVLDKGCRIGMSHHVVVLEGDNLYWDDDGVVKIMPLAGGSSRVIAAATDVYGIAVACGTVCWTTAGAVMKAPVAGGHAPLVAPLGQPLALGAGLALVTGNACWSIGGDCVTSAPR
jgi:hypothetical protein